MKKGRFFHRVLLGLAVVLLLGLGALAWSARHQPRFALAASQVAQLDWWTMDSGGGTSDGASFSLSGTLGQADAGPEGGGMSGANYELEGGFWPGVSSSFGLYLPVVRR